MPRALAGVLVSGVADWIDWQFAMPIRAALGRQRGKSQSQSDQIRE